MIKKSFLLLALGLCAAGAAVVPARAINLSADNNHAQDATQDVADAQTILERAGYLIPSEYRNGEIDTATAVAVRRFQVAHGLVPTGLIDFETMSQILSHAGSFDRTTTGASLFQGRGTVVLEGVRFDSDTARLRSSSRATLNHVADSLKAEPDAVVEIDGHTDSTNTERYNMRLSRQRSAAVCAYLVNQGVESSRLKEKGYGESRPIADNTTADGRARNRRVELTRID